MQSGRISSDADEETMFSGGKAANGKTFIHQRGAQLLGLNLGTTN